MNTTTESMQRYYDDPSLLDDCELEPTFLQKAYDIAYDDSVSDNFDKHQISKMQKVIFNIAANPNTPTETLKEMFQYSFKVFVGKAYIGAIKNYSCSDDFFKMKVIDYDGNILKAIVNNPVLPLLLLENPNLVEEWFLLDPTPYNGYLKAVNSASDLKYNLTMMLEYFNLGVIIDWLEVFKED